MHIYSLRELNKMRYINVELTYLSNICILTLISQLIHTDTYFKTGIIVANNSRSTYASFSFRYCIKLRITKTCEEI